MSELLKITNFILAIIGMFFDYLPKYITKIETGIKHFPS